MRLALLLALLALPALAGPVDDARADDAAAHRKLEALATEQAKLRSSLNEISAEVAAEKAAERGRVVSSAQLQADLRKAQALSDALDPLAKQLDAAQAEARAKDAALAEALGTEIARAEKAWSESKDPAQKAALVQQVRALHAERERLLPRISDPHAVVVQVEGDDPADLLAQADALRDSEDKVRRQLAELDRRLAEAKQTRELDRRMNELGADEAMFDEQDRRLRLIRNGNGAVTLDSSRGDGQFDAQQPGVGGTTAASGPPGPGPVTGPQTPGTSEAHASDHLPLVGEPPLSIPDSDDVGALEKARARLTGLAAALEARAKAAEEKARAGK